VLTKEALQDAVGPLWEVTDVVERSFEISMEEIPEGQRDKLMVEVEKVRNLAHGHQDAHGCPLIDSVWHAAQVLLGPQKYQGLKKMYDGEARDTITDLAVGMAILGRAEPSEAGATFLASEELCKGIEQQTERAIEAARRQMELDPRSAPPGEEGLLWLVSKELGWTELLPQAFELRKLGEWESDAEYVSRCKAVLLKLTALFPKPEEADDQ
jgi:hypothetical protein